AGGGRRAGRGGRLPGHVTRVGARRRVGLQAGRRGRLAAWGRTPNGHESEANGGTTASTRRQGSVPAAPSAARPDVGRSADGPRRGSAQTVRAALVGVCPELVGRQDRTA